MKGASGRYAGQIVNRSGTVNCAKVRFAGIVRVVSTTPGRMLPQIEPIPGKFDAAPKLLSKPLGVPMRLVNGGAMRLPVRPKFGPGPPTNGNCTNGWLKAGRKSGWKLVRAVEPLTLSGAMMMAGPLPKRPGPQKSCEFGRSKDERFFVVLNFT